MVKSKEEIKKETKGRGAACGRRLYPPCKRGFDILLSLVGLLLCAPLFFCIAFALRVSSPGPLFFRQTRLGRDMHPFTLYKFRTMTCTAPQKPSRDLADPDRYITRVGAFLRKTSLDELPQLYNVLRGDMSLLGPRPVMPEEHDLIARRAACGAYRVRPGLSGLSQIRGRDLLSNREKATLDGLYVRRLSFWQDACLLFATPFCVLFRLGMREGKPK